MLRYTGSIATDYPALRPAESTSDAFDGPDRTDERQAIPYPSPILPLIRSKNSNPIVKKLEHFARLDDADILALDALLAFAKELRAGQILIHESSVQDHVHLIVRGMACRYKSLPSGERQILGYLLPGDLFEFPFVTLNKPDHSVVLLSDSQVVKIPAQKIIALLAGKPRIERALSLAGLNEISILREWLLNVGQRNAIQKVSHFFCELAHCLARIDQVSEDGSFDLPINQMALADTTGLTPVHINRTLQRLRNDGLIRLCQRRLLILDLDRLATIAGFDDNYLQVKRCTR